MRISSKLSILAFIVGFLTIFMPVYFQDRYALTWLDIQESPPLWIYLIATMWVAAHDIGFLNGIFAVSACRNIGRIIVIGITGFIDNSKMELL